MTDNKLAPREESPFALMDALDDQQILDEIANRVVDTWCYHFIQRDRAGKLKELWGLSKKGVDQALMEIERSGIVYDEGRVTCEPDPTDENYMLFSAIVTRFRYTPDLRRLDMGSVGGYKRQKVTEDFWYEKGAAKAVRNAKARTIPTEVEAKIIAQAKAGNRVKDVPTSAAPAPAQAAPKREHPGADVQLDTGELIGKFELQDGTEWKYFWPACKNMGVNRDYVHEYLKTDSLASLPKAQLVQFLWDQYVERWGPRDNEEGKGGDSA